MRKQTLDTEVVFRDLTYAYDNVQSTYETPDKVRFWFITFVTLTQRLTATMRKEYADLTSQKWEPSAFSHWTPVTEFFKELRNVDYHELPIRIMIIQTQIYEGFRLERDESDNEKEIPVRMHAQMDYTVEAGYEKAVPKQTDIQPIDKEGNPMEAMVPEEIRYEYQVEGRTPKVEKLLSTTGLRNLHILATSCYETLCSYYEFYNTQLETNRK